MPETGAAANENALPENGNEMVAGPVVVRSSELRNSMPSITSVNSPRHILLESPNILEAYRHLTTKAVEQQLSALRKI